MRSCPRCANEILSGKCKCGEVNWETEGTETDPEEVFVTIAFTKSDIATALKISRLEVSSHNIETVAQRIQEELGDKLFQEGLSYLLDECQEYKKELRKVKKSLSI